LKLFQLLIFVIETGLYFSVPDPQDVAQGVVWYMDIQKKSGRDFVVLLYPENRKLIKIL